VNPNRSVKLINARLYAVTHSNDFANKLSVACPQSHYPFTPLLQIRGSNGFFFMAFAHCNKSDRAGERDKTYRLGG
jgi:hypothetical protein